MMTIGQILRGDMVEVVFGGGVEPLVGMVVNAPHREETHEKLGWLIQQDDGTVYSLGTYAYIRKIPAAD
jgi:hypothetical protein